MKIAILVREETMKKCTGKACFDALCNKKDSFEPYQTDIELLCFTHEGGDRDYKIRRMIEYGVDTVHLATCIRSKSEEYEQLAQKLSKHFNVVGYTHGSLQGEKRETIFLNKRQLAGNY